MTLPSSGPISLNDVWAEYGMPNNSRFPQDIYGKPGVPASGPLGLSDMYGKSNWLLTKSVDSLNVSSVTGGASGECTFTTTLPYTSMSYAVLSGTEPPVARRAWTAPTGTTGKYTINNPAGGGQWSYQWTIRVTATAAGLPDLTIDLNCNLDKEL
ncbi:hypothetical protein SAMN02927924_01441 [Sphingobium faniae]|nr:hypothetical protein SAMN02927924_01441 [Sphingobium faniae]